MKSSSSAAAAAAALFSEEDLDFFNYHKNSDSLELSSNSSGSQSNSTPSKSFMSTSSWSPSVAFPAESFEIDPLPVEELFSDLHLPSLGHGMQSKRLLSQILNGVYGPDQEFLRQFSVADQYATDRGQTALKALGGELSLTKEQNAELRLELKRVKDMVGRIKEDLHDLDIAESLFSQLSKMDPSQLTLKEFACVRAAEIYIPLRHELFVTKKQLEEVHIALEMNTTSLQTQQEVLARTRKHAQTAAESTRLDQRVAEEHIAKLSARLESEIAKRRESEDKAERCDSAMAENAKLRQELESIRSLMEDQSEALRSISASETQLKSLYDDLHRAKEMLQMDKTFLQKEVSELVTKDHQNQRVNETQATKIIQLDAKLLELTDQLTHIQQSTRTAFDEKMEREVQRLRDDYSKELEALKESSKDIIERENRVLREVKGSLQGEVEQLRRRLDDKDNELQRTYREMNAMNLSKDGEISSLRAELKMKSFEANSLGATFEERMGQLKAANLELEVLREEVSVHRSAILRLESESDSKELLLRENLSRAYETIRAYELLLHDSEGPSALASALGPDLSPSMPAQQSAWSSSLQNPPLPITVLASDPRKLRQLLETSERNAQKIVSLESKLREQTQTIAEYEKQHTETALKMDRATRCLSLVNQPSKYLLERLNEREAECHALEGRVRELEREREETQREKKRLELETGQLKERLQLLLSQRSEILSLRSMLEALRQEEERYEEGEDEGSEEEDKEEEQEGFGEGAMMTPVMSPGKRESFFSHSERDRDKGSSPPPAPPLSPVPSVSSSQGGSGGRGSLEMEATRPVTALELGLSPAALRSMLERTQLTPSKRRITQDQP